MADPVDCGAGEVGAIRHGGDVDDAEVDTDEPHRVLVHWWVVDVDGRVQVESAIAIEQIGFADRVSSQQTCLPVGAGERDGLCPAVDGPDTHRPVGNVERQVPGVEWLGRLPAESPVPGAAVLRFAGVVGVSHLLDRVLRRLCAEPEGRAYVPVGYGPQGEVAEYAPLPGNAGHLVGGGVARPQGRHQIISGLTVCHQLHRNDDSAHSSSLDLGCDIATG